MPVVLNVTGPHVIKWGAAGGSPSATLGRTDNDDLFSIEMEYKYQDVFTNELGQSPANAIVMGATAFVTFSLVIFDPSEVANLLQAIDANSGSGAVFPQVGAIAYNSTTPSSSYLVKLLVDADGSGPNYTVDRCRLISHTIKDVGNKPTRAAFRFEILPGTANSQIYSVS